MTTLFMIHIVFQLRFKSRIDTPAELWDDGTIIVEGRSVGDYSFAVCQCDLLMSPDTSNNFMEHIVRKAVTETSQIRYSRFMATAT
jgi:hypothetical protein